MNSDRPAGSGGRPETGQRRSLMQVRAAQLRARALRWAIGKSALGSVFLIGALAYALSPQRHTTLSRVWIDFLLLLSTLNVGLGLRTFSRVRRWAVRYWPISTALWGVLSIVLIHFLMRR
jgi:hypothetical protein